MVRLCVPLSVGWQCTLGVVGEALVMKSMTLEDVVDVFSIRNELLRPEDWPLRNTVTWLDDCWRLAVSNVCEVWLDPGKCWLKVLNQRHENVGGRFSEVTVGLQYQKLMIDQLVQELPSDPDRCWWPCHYGSWPGQFQWSDACGKPTAQGRRGYVQWHVEWI